MRKGNNGDESTRETRLKEMGCGALCLYFRVYTVPSCASPISVYLRIDPCFYVLSFSHYLIIYITKLKSFLDES